MRRPAFSAAMLYMALALSQARAQERRHTVGKSIPGPATGMLDPMITSPQRPIPNGPWRGNRVFLPPRAEDNLFIGYDFGAPPTEKDLLPPEDAPSEVPAAAAAALPDSAEPKPPEPPRPQPPEPVPTPPLTALQKETLAELDGYLYGPSPQRADPSLMPTTRPLAPESSVRGVLAGEPQTLPPMGAVNSHQSSALEPLAEIEDPAERTLEHDALPDLIELLRRGASRARARAADELGRRGPAASSALPALTEALASPDARLRASAVLAYGNIGGDPKKARRLLRDKNADVRLSAETALRRLSP